MSHLRIGRLPAALALVFGTAASLGLPAFGQATPGTRERVEVTGSNIKRIEGETALPVTVITRGDIERMGATTTEDIVKRVTANTAMFAETTQGVGYAQSTANLRGLGASSTLVLLNGRRLANYAFGSIGGNNASPAAVDLNSIPFSAIERVEVLRDGASAVYGTDAVGGVINFITRSDYRGAQVTGYYGAPEDNIGGTEQSATLAYGVGDLARDKWNLLATAHFEYKKRVKAIDQKLYARADQIDGASFPTSFRAFPGRLMDFGFSPGAYAGTLTNSPNIAGCDPEFTVLQVAGTTPSGDPRVRCRGIYAAYLDNLPDNHKADVFGRFTYELNPTMQYFLEASFARNHNIGRIAPVPIDQTAAHIRPDGTQPNILLPVTSRYAPIALLNRLGYSTADVGTPGFLEIAVRSANAGNRINDVTADQTRFSTGIKGSQAGWDYDTALTYAQSDSKLAVTGYIHEQRFIDALATGNLNPFGANDDATGDNLLNGAKMEGDMRKSKGKQLQLDGKASKEMWSMAGGMAAVAAGVDFRREEISDRAVNADYGAGLNIGGEGTVPNTDASRNVSAVFAEVSLPFTRQLEVTGAVRWDHYSDVGSKGSPQVRARFSPNRQWLLRASAGKGFRAPSLWDLHSAPQFGNSANSLVDPGCPPQLLADGDARCVDTQLNVRNIASPSLKPETSTQWSAGFVFEPVNTMSFAIDYWNIEKKDAIGAITADAILANPNDQTLYNQFINRFVRSPIGTTLYVDQPLENLGTLKTSGWDVDARVRFNPAFARVTLGFAGTYVDKYEQQLASGFAAVSYLGNSFNGGNAYPRWQHVATLDVENGPWLGTLEQTYVNGWTEAFLAGGTHEIPSTSRVNLAVKYSGFRNLAVKLGVRNVMDRLPPYTDVSSNGSHAAGFANAIADPRGRFWYGVVQYTFR